MKTRILSVVIASSLLLGCKESFFDINDNPNNPTEKPITADLVLPTVIHNTAKRMVTNYNFAAMWMGYWSRGSSFGVSVPLESYAITSTYETGHWSGVVPTSGWYDIMKDNDVVEKKGLASNELFYVGVAKVMKSIAYMYLVDMYNNVPYTEAMNIDSKMNPKYDKGEDIYKDLLLQLDSARTIFKTADLLVSDKAKAADLLFKGDLMKWRKLANTQALKLLIHQSEKVNNPSAEIQKITQDGAGFIAANESVTYNPGFSNDIYKLNSAYTAYVRDHTGTLIDNFNRANNFVLNKYIDNGDSRYKYIFKEATTPANNILFRGTNFGAANIAGERSNQQSIVIGKGIAAEPSSDMWLFTSVESLFLQAEAIQRGWLTGNAEQAYRSAVKESFNYLGVDDAVEESTNYLDSKNIAKWSTNSNKLELIINQKYLALTSLNNFEAWVDYRRLGFPTDVPLSLNPSAAGMKIPLRLIYPQNEYAYNEANVKAEGTIDAQKDKIWWDVN